MILVKLKARVTPLQSQFKVLLKWFLVPAMIAGFSISPGYAEMSSAASFPSSEAHNAATSAEPSLDTKTPAPEAVTPFNEKNNSSIAVKPPAKIGSGGHLLSVTLGLIAIIALIFALSFFVKRFGSGAFSANTQLKILSSMPLGTRERIVLIDAAGQQLLLGITPTNINTLHVFAEPIAMDSKAEGQSDFSRKLMAILQQKTVGTSPDRKNDSASQE